MWFRREMVPSCKKSSSRCTVSKGNGREPAARITNWKGPFDTSLAGLSDLTKIDHSLQGEQNLSVAQKTDQCGLSNRLSPSCYTQLLLIWHTKKKIFFFLNDICTIFWVLQRLFFQQFKLLKLTELVYLCIENCLHLGNIKRLYILQPEGLQKDHTTTSLVFPFTISISRRY